MFFCLLQVAAELAAKMEKALEKKDQKGKKEKGGEKEKSQGKKDEKTKKKVRASCSENRAQVQPSQPSVGRR